jgi:LysR family transcriptional regulator, benzoate and cis,cis-muconate-responsive activator of ben and cat genes
MSRFASQVDIRHLRYLESIVRNGSFRSAAVELNISQPPLTRQIQQLETIVGAPLLVRRAKGIEPTAAGAALCVEARNILNLMETACMNARLIGSGQLGRLDVGVFGSAVFDIVPRIVAAFRTRFPLVEVSLHNMDRATQIKALHERRIMVGFNRFFQDHPDLLWEPIVHEPMVAVVPRHHPLAARTSVRLEDLAGEPLILYPRTNAPGGFGNYLYRQFHQAGFEPKVVQNVDDVVTAVSFVSSGVGLTVGVSSAQNLRLPGVTYVPLEETGSAEFDLCMIYRASEESVLLGEFLNTVREVVGPRP